LSDKGLLVVKILVGNHFDICDLYRKIKIQYGSGVSELLLGNCFDMKGIFGFDH
jgi:hypothetical protein